MAENVSKSQYSNRLLATWVVSQVRKAILEAQKPLNSLQNKVFRVKVVENSDQKPILEVAKNTRGVKDRLDRIFTALTEKSMVLPEKIAISNLKDIQFPKNVDEVRISNLRDIKFPRIPTPQVTTNVDLSPLVRGMEDVSKQLSALSTGISQVNTSVSAIDVKPQVNVPQTKVNIPDKVSLKDLPAVLEAFQGLRDDFGRLYEAIVELPSKMPKTGGFGGSTSAAVTSVNVNALRGLARSTVVSISTTPTLLPSVALSYRKSLIVFNNSANTIYIGGVDVSVSNGYPVEANSPSPSIDAGMNMKLYAVADSASEVRVLEVSSEREGA